MGRVAPGQAAAERITASATGVVQRRERAERIEWLDDLSVQPHRRGEDTAVHHAASRGAKRFAGLRARKPLEPADT